MGEPYLKPSLQAGYDEDTLERMKASDDNLRGIIAGRRRAAAALMVTDQGPAQAVVDATAPLVPEIHPPLKN